VTPFWGQWRDARVGTSPGKSPMATFVVSTYASPGKHQGRVFPRDIIHGNILSLYLRFPRETSGKALPQGYHPWQHSWSLLTLPLENVREGASPGESPMATFLVSTYTSLGKRQGRVFPREITHGNILSLYLHFPPAKSDLGQKGNFWQTKRKASFLMPCDIISRSKHLILTNLDVDIVSIMV